MYLEWICAPSDWLVVKCIHAEGTWAANAYYTLITFSSRWCRINMCTFMQGKGKIHFILCTYTKHTLTRCMPHVCFANNLFHDASLCYHKIELQFYVKMMLAIRNCIKWIGCAYKRHARMLARCHLKHMTKPTFSCENWKRFRLM